MTVTCEVEYTVEVEMAGKYSTTGRVAVWPGESGVADVLTLGVVVAGFVELTRGSTKSSVCVWRRDV